MVKYKLANVFVESNDRYVNDPGLYIDAQGLFKPEGSSFEFMLAPYGSFDFSTYFNSLSMAKWREYTSIDNVGLHIEVMGDASIELLEIDELSIGVHKWIVNTVAVQSDTFESIDIPYPGIDKAIISFRIVTNDVVHIRNAYYYSEIAESRIREANIAIVTTTFKKEDYIAANIKMFSDDIRASKDAIADKCSFIIVDNGQSLDTDEFETEGVYIFPNMNVGGAGGFARGMIEAQHMDVGFTHVLIMDDDVSLSPEAIKKTYNLISIANDRYKNAFVSGAMFSLGVQSKQIEDLGYANALGKFGAVKSSGDMCSLENLLKNETCFIDKQNKYAAFWYCCIPMTAIKKYGLPLPIFIRYDDAEYGMRCKPRFMTMNGINIWHLDFNDRYSAVYEQYFGVRNSFVIQSVSGVCVGIDFLEQKVNKPFIRELNKFHYGSAELILDGLEDYLKGPDWLAVNRCQETLQAKNKVVEQEKMRSFKELGLKTVDIDKVRQKSKSLRKRDNILFSRTFNGHTNLPKRFLKGGTGWAKFSAGATQNDKVFLRDRFIEVDRNERNAIISTRDSQRFETLMMRYHQLLKLYQEKAEDVAKQYKDAAGYLTSEEFWATYLGLEDNG